MSLNRNHGPSVVRLIPTTDEHRAAMTDMNAEIVYVALEEFEDGLCSVNVCWRPVMPPSPPNVKKPEQPTYLSSIIQYFKERFDEAA